MPLSSKGSWLVLSYSQKIFSLEVSKWISKNSVLKSVQSSCHVRRTRFASDITSSSRWLHNFQVQKRAHNTPASTYRICVPCMLRRKKTCVVRAKKRTQCSSWKTSWAAQKKHCMGCFSFYQRSQTIEALSMVLQTPSCCSTVVFWECSWPIPVFAALINSLACRHAVIFIRQIYDCHLYSDIMAPSLSSTFFLFWLNHLSSCDKFYDWISAIRWVERGGRHWLIMPYGIISDIDAIWHIVGVGCMHWFLSFRQLTQSCPFPRTFFHRESFVISSQIFLPFLKLSVSVILQKKQMEKRQHSYINVRQGWCINAITPFSF